jgi:tetratricopeptide (TPR) repeat protein
MNRYQTVVLGTVLMLLVAFSTGCNKLKARNDLNEGVIAFKNADFNGAVEDFQEAVNLDPTLLNARLFLATSLTHMYQPGADDASNVKAGETAIKAYNNVLAVDPNNTNALASIGYLYYEMQKFDQAKQYQEKLMQVQPNNPVPHYWIGVIDWPLCYKQQMQLRHNLHLDVPKKGAPAGVLPPLPAKARNQLQQQISPMVDEALTNLQKAVQLQPNDANAYTYLNLMLRVKADLEPSPAARMADLNQANTYYQRALKLMHGASSASSASSTS